MPFVQALFRIAHRICNSLRQVPQGQTSADTTIIPPQGATVYLSRDVTAVIDEGTLINQMKQLISCVTAVAPLIETSNFETAFLRTANGDVHPQFQEDETVADQVMGSSTNTLIDPAGFKSTTESGDLSSDAFCHLQDAKDAILSIIKLHPELELSDLAQFIVNLNNQSDLKPEAQTSYITTFGKVAHVVKRFTKDKVTSMVFGVSLEELFAQYGGGMSKSDFVPPLVSQSITYLDLNWIRTNVSYRSKGNKKRVAQLKEEWEVFHKEYAEAIQNSLPLPTMEFCGFECRDVVEVLKDFLRQLPDPIIPASFYHAFLAVEKLAEHPEDQTELLRQLVNLMPDLNRHSLNVIISHLCLVSTIESINLGVVIGPYLLRKGGPMNIPNKRHWFKHGKPSVSHLKAIHEIIDADHIVTRIIEENDELFKHAQSDEISDRASEVDELVKVEIIEPVIAVKAIHAFKDEKVPTYCVTKSSQRPLMQLMDAIEEEEEEE